MNFPKTRRHIKSVGKVYPAADFSDAQVRVVQQRLYPAHDMQFAVQAGRHAEGCGEFREETGTRHSAPASDFVHRNILLEIGEQRMRQFYLCRLKALPGYHIPAQQDGLNQAIAESVPAALPLIRGARHLPEQMQKNDNFCVCLVRCW